MTHQIYADRYKRLDQKLREGPSGPFVDELASVLVAKGYPEKYLKVRFKVIRALNQWLIRRKVNLSQLDTHRINQFVRYRSKQTEMCRRGEIVTLNKLISIMKNRGVIPNEVAVCKPKSETERVLSTYKEYLIEEQGLSLTTISRYFFQSRKFLCRIFHLQPVNFSTVSAQDIVTFIREYAREHSAAESSMMVCSVRSFLRFLVLRGEIGASLVECVPTVPSRRHQHIPSHLSGEELAHLLKCSKGKRPVQRRNYAILLLLAQLGLRASEVATLTLDDIDWEQGELTIQGKGNKQTQLPLPVDVGNALVAYLKHARPACSTRRVFISIRPPHRPFKNGVAVSTIVNRSVKRAGLNPLNKGAHLLRHTLATVCLRKGATLPEIGEILRHESIDTTAIYAKVDFTRLRTLVMSWPAPSFNGGEQ